MKLKKQKLISEIKPNGCTPKCDLDEKDTKNSGSEVWKTLMVLTWRNNENK